MNSNNPFDQFDIEHLSASSINLFIQDIPLFIVRYLAKHKSPTNPAMLRGTVIDHAIGNKTSVAEAQKEFQKIMNYEKFIYEEGKKSKSKSLETKEIKFGPNTSENDVEYRIKHIVEFLDKGHKVKITMQFKGRQMVHVDKGQELLLKLILEVEEHGTAEALPKLEGKKMFVTLKPKPKK